MSLILSISCKKNNVLYTNSSLDSCPFDNIPYLETITVNGIYIALEGPDFSGKTTQAKLIAKLLRARGHAVCEVREPGGTLKG